MRHGKIFNLAMGCVVVMATTLAAHEAQSAGPTAPRQVTPNSAGHGFASVYGDMPADQADLLSTPDDIKRAGVVPHARGGAGARRRWRALTASPPSPHSSTTQRQDAEIAAWWLRRRILGVFARAVYEKTTQTLPTPR
jgi:hypothetical protein